MLASRMVGLKLMGRVVAWGRGSSRGCRRGRGWVRLLQTVVLGLLIVALAGGGGASAATHLPDYPPVRPGQVLQFPRDGGAHPDYRTEWWYVTGWLQDDSGPPMGFQITFFRSRPPLDTRDPSRFAPDQLLFAHAALADPRVGRLVHDQRAARAGFGLAQASARETRVRIGDWSLVRTAEGYHSVIQASTFSLSLDFKPTQPVLLEGDRGYSRKGPDPAQASNYVSEPQLDVVGTVERAHEKRTVRGTAWLDHEWSSELLAPGAVGWDWTGINLKDGGAVMAFRIRDAAGRPIWAGGAYRDAGAHLQILQPDDVAFTARRVWRSARTGAEYPVAMQVRAGPLRFTLDPLMADQELDSRASTGSVYWEGAVRARQDDEVIGQGYLELTGYFRALDF